MPDVVSILAGGWSARSYDVHRLPGYVIGVNDAGLYGRCDAIVSMDRLWTEARWSWMCGTKRAAWIRRAALKNIPPNWPGYVTAFECDHEAAQMSDDPRVLNGTNSGLCAVNLAYRMRPKALRIYGMDLKRGPNGERHWYADYDFKPPEKGTGDGTFKAWRDDLSAAVAQCQARGIEVQIMRGAKGA